MLNYGKFHRYSESRKVILLFLRENLNASQRGIRLRARIPGTLGWVETEVVQPERSVVVWRS